MTGTQLLLALISFGALMLLAICFVVMRSRRHFAAARVPMSLVAAQSGWQDVRPVVFQGAGIEGTWNGYRVRIGFEEPVRNFPPHLFVSAETQSENVLSVKRGMIGGKKRPRPIFGWKEIEMAAAPDLMVRGDSRMLADRVFANQGIVSRIRGNLFSIEDELLIDRKRTRIRRAISKKTMKGRMRGDLTAEFDHTVFDEWGLIAALLSEITLRA